MASYGKSRLNWLDALRGITIILMVIYHTCWDLVYIYGHSIPWYQGRPGEILQQFICFSFILISGYSFHLGGQSFRRGLIIFGCGVLVTIVTLVFLPQSPIYIGILTFIGSAVLLATLLHKFLNRWHALFGVVLNAVLFVLFRGVNRGYLGFSHFPIATLSPGLYKNWLTAYLGFPFPGFSSSDYFSILPWIFLFFIGYFFYLLTKGFLAKTKGPIHRWGVLSFLGRHSLIIYLGHQVVIYVALAVLHWMGIV